MTNINLLKSIGVIMLKFKILTLATAIAALAGCATTAHHGSHTTAHGEHDHGWSYEHPEKWGDLEVNKLCSTGVEQSPINITEVVAPLSGQVNISEQYQAQDFSVSNNGHSIVFDVVGTAASSIKINNTDYRLLQFHYHIPSEHTVMNAHYPLEIHFVHQNAQGGLAVVGVLVNLGQHNASLQQIITGLPKANAKGSLNNFNIGALMPADGTTYAYDGSLTTPPCGEKVQWLLKANAIDASSSQLSILSALYNGNNRPVQPLGNRQVTLVK